MNHVLLELRDYPRAKMYAERAILVCQNTGFQRMLPSALLSLAVAETEMGDLDAAGEHLVESVKLARMLQMPSGIIDPLRYLADVRMWQGNYAEAFEHLQDGLALSRDGNILYYLCEIHAALARWYLDQNQPDAARDPLREAVSFALKLGSDNFLVLVLTPAMRLWQGMGEAEQAARWAGLLSGHRDYLTPRLYEPICAGLERELGAARLGGG
jgi:tetratricopeptide (TPR) repeat protein